MQPIFKVSEFNEMVNVHLARLGEVVIVGEISKINLSQGKWLFITLKDEYSSVDVFGVAFQLSGWKSLEEGMLVNVRGVASLHQKSGKFSIRAEDITPAGEGSLRIAFEKLRRQLETEGLFELSRKRSLPRFPQNIALITAKGSQAYNDFTKVLKNRLGGLHIYFIPASVQGTLATKELIQAIKYTQKHLPHLDALVLCRGGGSLEDLQAFNDEYVVRAIFASTIPTVVGVGHEGDVSLADLVADVRASTPSNAAELLVPERAALLNEINHHINRIDSLVQRDLKQKTYLADRALTILEHSFSTYITHIKHTITLCLGLSDKFSTHIHNQTILLNQREQQLNISLTNAIRTNNTRIDTLQRLLKNLDYHTVLKRGFSITRSSDGRIIRSTTNITHSTELETTVQDGTIYSQVTKKQTKNTYA